jgi:Acyl-CoA reductase (LuxC)
MTASQGASTQTEPGQAPRGHARVHQLVPRKQSVDLADLLARLNSTPVALPFDQSRMDFLADLSLRLGRVARGLPETQALAFWMRKSELRRLEQSFAALGSQDIVLMPRGTVFHIPPSNVDTLFVYQWVLSTLLGNRNIVRLSSRATQQSNVIVETIAKVLIDHPGMGDSTSMVTYGHDDATTAAISAVCDVRAIWGGDASVTRIRAIPIRPHASELTFADRFSMAAISIDAYQALSDQDRDRLAELFFNDTYWFDQLGCSSARLVLWVGGVDPQPIATDFYRRVRAVAQIKNYTVDAAPAMAKLTQAYGAMVDTDVSGYLAVDNTMTVLDVATFPDVRGAFCGAGFFYQLHVNQLAEIAPHIRRADQTLATFGIPRSDLMRLVREVGGRGIDRIVPIGQALQFNRYWDGYDLLAELTRKVSVSVSEILP